MRNALDDVMIVFEGVIETRTACHRFRDDRSFLELEKINVSVSCTFGFPKKKKIDYCYYYKKKHDFAEWFKIWYRKSGREQWCKLRRLYFRRIFGKIYNNLFWRIFGRIFSSFLLKVLFLWIFSPVIISMRIFQAKKKKRRTCFVFVSFKSWRALRRFRRRLLFLVGEKKKKE